MAIYAGFMDLVFLPDIYYILLTFGSHSEHACATWHKILVIKWYQMMSKRWAHITQYLYVNHTLCWCFHTLLQFLVIFKIHVSRLFYSRDSTGDSGGRRHTW